MSKSSFCLECGHHDWRLYWWIEEVQDLGGALGEMPEFLTMIVPPADAEDLTVWATTRAVAMLPGTERDAVGFFWESKKHAIAARRVADAAVKAAADNRPMPEWATQAIAAGWKAPKGWKP